MTARNGNCRRRVFLLADRHRGAIKAGRASGPDFLKFRYVCLGAGATHLRAFDCGLRPPGNSPKSHTRQHVANSSQVWLNAASKLDGLPPNAISARRRVSGDGPNKARQATSSKANARRSAAPNCQTCYVSRQVPGA